jgi:hypothetical protein
MLLYLSLVVLPIMYCASVSYSPMHRHLHFRFNIHHHHHHEHHLLLLPSSSSSYSISTSSPAAATATTATVATSVTSQLRHCYAIAITIYNVTQQCCYSIKTSRRQEAGGRRVHYLWYLTRLEPHKHGNYGG